MRPCRWARTQRAEGTGQARQKSQPLWLPGDSLPKFDDRVFFFFYDSRFPSEVVFGDGGQAGKGRKGSYIFEGKAERNGISNGN